MGGGWWFFFLYTKRCFKIGYSERPKKLHKTFFWKDTTTVGAVSWNFIKKYFFTHNFIFFWDSSKIVTNLDSAGAIYSKYEFSWKSELKWGHGSCFNPNTHVTLHRFWLITLSFPWLRQLFFRFLCRVLIWFYIWSFVTIG